MRALVQLNLLLFLRLNAWLITSVAFLLLAFAHSASLPAGRSNIGDYLLLSAGGVFVHDSLFKLFGWAGTILPILLYLNHLMGATSGFDVFILNRSGSRARWWSSKVIAAVCLSIFYSAWYILIHYLVGMLTLPMESDWSVSTLWMVLLFVTGMFAFCSLAQTIALFSRNSSVGYVWFMIGVFILGIAYLQGALPKTLSPMMYPSFIYFIQKGTEGAVAVKRAISYNILLAFILFCINIWLVRRYVYASGNE